MQDVIDVDTRFYTPARRAAGAQGHFEFQLGQFLASGQRANQTFGLTRQIVEDADGELGEQLRAMGLSTLQRARTLVFDVRFSLAVAVLAAFGRAIAEVGAVLVVGGNIAGHTRTMTTAISLETQKGDLPLALALGFVLLAIVIVVNAAAAALRSHAARRYG